MGRGRGRECMMNEWIGIGLLRVRIRDFMYGEALAKHIWSEGISE